MTPDRLVTIRRYPYRELAATDQQLLADADIETYVKGYGRAELMVPEEQAGQALELLSASPQILSEHEELPRCPYCQSADVDSRPPYALIALGVGFACSAIATVYRRYTMAFVIGVLTAALATLMQVNVPRWRCRICGREYGTMSGR